MYIIGLSCVNQGILAVLHLIVGVFVILESTQTILFLYIFSYVLPCILGDIKKVYNKCGPRHTPWGRG